MNHVKIFRYTRRNGRRQYKTFSMLYEVILHVLTCGRFENHDLLLIFFSFTFWSLVYMWCLLLVMVSQALGLSYQRLGMFTAAIKVSYCHSCYLFFMFKAFLLVCLILISAFYKFFDYVVRSPDVVMLVGSELLYSCVLYCHWYFPSISLLVEIQNTIVLINLEPQSPTPTPTQDHSPSWGPSIP